MKESSWTKTIMKIYKRKLIIYSSYIVASEPLPSRVRSWEQNLVSSLWKRRIVKFFALSNGLRLLKRKICTNHCHFGADGDLYFRFYCVGWHWWIFSPTDLSGALFSLSFGVTTWYRITDLLICAIAIWHLALKIFIASDFDV